VIDNNWVYDDNACLLLYPRPICICTCFVQFSSVNFSDNIYVSRKSNNPGLWRLRYYQWWAL